MEQYFTDNDINYIINLLDNYKEELSKDDYDNIFLKVRQCLRSTVYIFLSKYLDIDVLAQQTTLYPDELNALNFSDVTIPENITYIDSFAIDCCRIDKLEIRDNAQRVICKSAIFDCHINELIYPESSSYISTGFIFRSTVHLIKFPKSWDEKQKETRYLELKELYFNTIDNYE